jgi:hypothetical protein
MGDTITCHARRGNHRRQLGQGVHRDETWADRQHGTGHAIRHPDRNRGRADVVLAQPQLATIAHAALHANRLAMQRMPRIVDRDLLSVVGGM